MKDVTYGRYLDKDSVVHRMNADVKLVGMLVCIMLCFVADTWIWLGVMALVLACMIIMSKISILSILKAIKTTAIMLAVFSLINIFTVDGSVLWQLRTSGMSILRITEEGLLRALMVFIRLIMITSASVLFIYTTKTKDVLNALSGRNRKKKSAENVLSGRNKKKPSGSRRQEYAMIITIAIRFIPILSEELRRIRMAQKMRGLDIKKGNIFRRFKASAAVIIPLFQAAVKRAEAMAEAMEMRGY